jgi:cell division initiation protein
MDITPQLLKEVKFSESWRGYDRDEVDEFLERVGAGVAVVQARLRESAERADAAEARALTLGSRSEAEETLKRTLVLAQRTADAAVAEANETAARTVAEAEARSSRTIADAEAHAAVLRAEAEAEVRRVIESTRAPLVDEIKELERVRNFLRDDIELLESHLTTQRERLRAQLADLQSMLEQPTTLRTEPAPETSGVDPTPALPPRDETWVPTPTAVAAPIAPPVADIAPPPEATFEAHDTTAEATDRVSGGHDLRWSDDADVEVPEADAGPFARGFDVSDDREVADLRFTPDPFDSAGPPTQPVATFDDFDTSMGDSFLDQLRRVVDDDGDDDGAMTAFFDQDEDERPRSRFGRRR